MNAHWSREGRILHYDGERAIDVVRYVDSLGNAKFSPTMCDAIASYVCDALNRVNVDALHGAWMSNTRAVASGEGRRPDLLTARERQVMILLASGRTNKEIADELGISSKTVDTHRGHVIKKLAVRNNADITRYAIKHGYIAL